MSLPALPSCVQVYSALGVKPKLTVWLAVPLPV